MEVALNSMGVGQRGTVTAVKVEGAMLRRLLDIGIVSGTKLSCVMKSPLGDPTAYLIRGALIALRKEDSEKIIIKLDYPSQEVKNNGSDNTVGRRASRRCKYRR
ncbi:MAG: FeoA family protein [Acutalibacteraceae bacterium]|nr:FeoA family protein [Acutalibacteraceae bacterium]